MGCFPANFQEIQRPLRTKSGKCPIKVGKRPIKEGKLPIKAMVLVGISVGCLMGCFRAPPPWRKTAPLKRPIKRSMSCRIFRDFRVFLRQMSLDSVFFFVRQERQTIRIFRVFVSSGPTLTFQSCFFRFPCFFSFCDFPFNFCAFLLSFFVVPHSQNLAVKEFCFVPRGKCGGFFVKFLAATFPGS